MIQRRAILPIVCIALVAQILPTACRGHVRDIARPPAAPAARTTPAAGGSADDLDAEIIDLRGRLASAEAQHEIDQRRAREAENAAWRHWSRIAAAGVVALSAALVGLGVWLGFLRLAAPIAAIACGAAFAVQGWAEALAYAVWIAPAMAIAVIAVLVVALLRHRAALGATARLADVIENEIEPGKAKAAAYVAQIHAGVHQFVQRARREKKPL